MRLADFIAGRQGRWHDLESRTRSLGRRGARSLSTDELDAISRLFRLTASDLSIARRDFPDEDVTEYLNNLCSRVRPTLTPSDPLHWGSVPHYFAVSLPRRWRAAWPFMLSSAVLGLGAGIIAFLVGSVRFTGDMQSARTLVSSSLYGDELYGVISAGDVSGLLSTLFVTLNNMRVALLMLGGGITGGLLTVYSIIANFWMLGMFLAAGRVLGVDYTLGSYITAHGIIEMSLFTFLGGCGLMLAWGMVHPGLLSRQESIVASGRSCLALGGGLTLVLIVCGTIEGFVSAGSEATPVPRYVIGVVGGLLLYAWLLLGGRELPSRARRRQVAIAADALAGI